MKLVLLIIPAVFLAGPACMLFRQPLHLGDSLAKDRAFHTIKRAKLSPEPACYPGAVVQVLAARAWGIRGLFAEHTWIASKRTTADTYTIYQVKGWYFIEQKRSALEICPGIPDLYWMGAKPRVLFDLRGAAADKAIDGIEAAAARYPCRQTYRAWPGPNSNTFTAFMLRAVPEISFDLPVTAIGKDYLPDGRWVLRTPSRTGYQLSLGGLAGMSVGLAEGLEVNLLGLNFKFDILGPAIEVPGVGRLLGT